MDELNMTQSIGGALASGELAALRAMLSEMNVVDIALAIEELSTEELLRVFRILPKDMSADVFSYLEPESQERLVRSITDTELEALLDDLFLDDTVDFLEEVPATIVRRVLAQTDPETRALINRFLSYPDDSAGSIMTIEMVALHDNITVQQAIEQIRQTGVDKETIYTCYCIGTSRKLLGAVPLHRLLLSDPQAQIRDIMDENQQLQYVHTLDERSIAADIAQKYDLLSVPVVDKEGRLVGIITIDDIVDVIEEETTEDMERMALLRPAEDSYLKTGVLALARNRIIWLLVLMISATFTGIVIQHYEGILAGVIGLTAAIPMLMGTGGNASNQVSTLVIRSMAVGDVRPRDYLVILLKELRVALICGLILGAVNIGRMLLFSEGGLPVYLVVSGSIVLVVIVAKAIGCTLPILAKLIHLDPALMAGPMISTLLDMITLIIYLGLASAFLDVHV